VWSILSDSIEVVLLCDANIKGAGRKDAMKLKLSLVVLSRRALGFTIVEYLDLNCLLCISNIHL
jgi:hypothetical protein